MICSLSANFIIALTVTNVLMAPLLLFAQIKSATVGRLVKLPLEEGSFIEGSLGDANSFGFGFFFDF